MPVRKASSLVDLVGNTAMLRLDASAYLKLELMNPTRCVADRIIRSLFQTSVFSDGCAIRRLDPLSLSALVLGRASGIRFCLQDDAICTPELQHLMNNHDCYFSPQNRDASLETFDALVEPAAESILSETWAEILREIQDDLPEFSAEWELVIPYLPWAGLENSKTQLRAVQKCHPASVLVQPGAAENHPSVSPAQAVLQCQALARSSGITPGLLSGEVASVVREKSRVVGVIVDSAEWNHYQFEI